MTDFPRITLETKGSSDFIYEINILKDEGHLRMTCTCAAGANSNHICCKHRTAIILGDYNNLIKQSPHMDLINEEIQKTSWRAELETIDQLLKDESKLKRKIQKAKKDLGKSLKGNLSSYF